MNSTDNEPKAPSDSSQKESVSAESKQEKPLYVVGIGASAGGLEAFEEFFKNIPPDTGLAFVLVPHLDPTHKGLIPELLQRSTAMDVLEVENEMKVQPNHIYVIPPNKDMTIVHGSLQLLEPSQPRGLRMPIDFFFRNLAEDQREKSIVIILSGMGTDGTLGIKTIKERQGLVMVQDPGSAKYSGMPESAISTGLADYIAPANELPGKLLSHLDHYHKLKKMPPIKEKESVDALKKIFNIVWAHTGNDFSLYKKSTICRRIERRMSIRQITNINQYASYLQENPQEVDLLFKELLIRVTSFFREPISFESLKTKAIPEIMKNKKPGDLIRIWVVGCSTGEEAYSIAILFQEYLEDQKPKGNFKIQIYATDIDKEAIDTARQGFYPTNIVADVSPERLQRFFIKDEDHYRIKKEIRDSIVFSIQNVIVDPPFIKLDLLSCRNLLIYLGPELQKKLFPIFHYALNPGGILFLGSSESIGDFTDRFSTIDSKWKIFKQKETPLAYKEPLEFPISPLLYEARVRGAAEAEVRRYAGPNIADTAQKVIIQTIVPPVAIINDRGDIIYLTRRTGKYLEPPVGKATTNIYAMAREGLRAELGIAVRKAMTNKTDVTIKGLRIKTNGSDQMINLTVTPLEEPESMRGMLMVQFADVETPPEIKKPGEKSESELVAINRDLENELQSTREHLQTIIEEMETSQEELKSANEELQSTNEELQSTNEELVTSKEEMQSLNEEMTTLNAELRFKNEELTTANNDMSNFINNMQVPTIFLDNDMKLKRFTPQATKIISLIPSDIGRPITDIASNLQYKDLTSDATNVLSTLMPKEVQVQTKEGTWYLMRIVPYRTIENVINGVVITFSNITELKRTTESLTERTEFAENIIHTVREPLVILNDELKVVSANPLFYRMFHMTPQDTEGKSIYDLGNGQWNIPALRKLLEEVILENAQVEDFLVEHDFPQIGHKKMQLNARKITHEDPHKQLILLAIEDITIHKES